MSTHTPEPWHHGTDEDAHIVYAVPFETVAVADTLTEDGDAEIEAGNAERIVACVNALAGVEDPAAFVKSHAAIVKASEAVDVVLSAFGTRPCGEAEFTALRNAHIAMRNALAEAKAVQP